MVASNMWREGTSCITGAAASLCIDKALDEGIRGGPVIVHVLLHLEYPISEEPYCGATGGLSPSNGKGNISLVTGLNSGGLSACA